jgi:hypothetical protein
MKYPRMIAAGVVAAASLFTVAACADVEPTAPQAVESSSPDLKRSHPTKAAERAALLTNVPVTGALSDGGSFAGTFTARRLSIDEATRQLSMTGVLTGIATRANGATENVTQLFTTTLDMTSSRNVSSSGVNARNVANAECDRSNETIYRQASMYRQVQASCDVLFLELGPLSLDLLGLTVDLNQVVLDINAVTGAGNLLGNLLCALLGLLDGIALFGAITSLLESINAILEGIGGLTGASYIAPALDAASYTIS